MKKKFEKGIIIQAECHICKKKFTTGLTKEKFEKDNKIRCPRCLSVDELDNDLFDLY